VPIQPVPAVVTPPVWEAVFTVAAAGVAGGLVGSFLNVVAHRVPRGESFVGGRSRCPACGAPIRARDNVPVLGWLLLGGRCRDCRRPIPVRYPVVEAACGLAVAALALSTAAAPAASRLPLLFDRAAVVLALMAWLLLALDGTIVRTATAAAAAGLAAVAAVIWPALAAWGVVWDGRPWPDGPAWLATVTAAVAGAAAGWIGGGACAGAAGRNVGLLAGATLGWHAMAVMTVAGLVLRAALPRSVPPVAAVTAVAHAMLIFGPAVGRAWRAVSGP
jgi:leader peptidase (prepilin peptidase)/N-methyltransferase